MKSMSIGELSERSGVKVTTIRYYEQVGLISKPERSAGGRRMYRDEDLKQITFIRHSRHLGFSPEAIRSMIQLQAVPDDDCGPVNETAQKQLALVRERISQLQALERELERIAQSCEGGKVGECRVMEALNDHGQCETERHERIEGL